MTTKILSSITLIIFCMLSFHHQILGQPPTNVPGNTELGKLIREHSPYLIFSDKEQYYSSTIDYYLDRCRLYKDDNLYTGMPNGDEVLVEHGGVDQYFEDQSNSTMWGDDLRLYPVNSNTKYGFDFYIYPYVHVSRAYDQDLPYFEDYIDIQYWFFFPYNGRKGFYGDWRYITARIDVHGDLKKVYMSKEDGGKWYTPNELSWTSNGTNSPHYKAYVANGSHSFYKKSGYNDIGVLDHCGGGTEYSIIKMGFKLISIDEEIYNHGMNPVTPNWLYYDGRWGSHFNYALYQYKSQKGPLRNNQFLWNGVKSATSSFYKKTALPGYAILGGEVLCSTANKTYSLNNSNVNFTNYNWNVSDNSKFTTDSSTGSSITTRSQSASYHGAQTITASVKAHYNAYSINYESIKKTIWLGRAKNFSNTIGGPTNPSFGTYVQYTLANDNPLDKGVYEWLLPGESFGGIRADEPGGNNWARISGGDGYQYTYAYTGVRTGYVQVRKCNECGTSGVTIKRITVNTSGGGSPEFPHQERYDKNGSEDKITDQFSIDTDVSIYPNPASEELNVSIKNNFFSSDQISVIIYDIKGQIIVEEKTELKDFSLDVRSLNKGYYFIKLTDSNKKQVKKFLIK